MIAFGTPVGADLSRPSPIHRPSLDVLESGFMCEKSLRITVTLSAAKHLFADRDRPFAALRVTPGGSSMHDNAVMLSAAKHLDAHPSRPFAALRVTPNRPSLDVPLYS